MSERRGPKITSDPTLGGTKQKVEEIDENIMPEPSLSQNEELLQNEDTFDITSDESENQESNTKIDDAELDDLFSIETEEELEKIVKKGKESYSDGDLSDVSTQDDLEIPTYNVEDISQRIGNYILTLGLPGSGKTTVQSFMTYTAKNYSAGIDRKGRHLPGFFVEHRKNDDGSQNIDAERVVLNWDMGWKKLRFPSATPVGQKNVREIRLRFNNIQNKKQSFNLSFLEVSGEDINQVRVDKGWKPHLLETLDKFLQNTNLKYNFVWVIDPRKDDNDVLFQNFISYFDTLETISKDNIGLMIVISHPRAALEKIREHPNEKYNSIEYNELSKKKNKLAILSLVAPQTLSIFDFWKVGKKSLMVYDIGELETGIDEDNKQIPKLKKPRFESSREFIEWHYEQLEGKKFSLPFSKKIMRLFGS